MSPAAVFTAAALLVAACAPGPAGGGTARILADDFVLVTGRGATYGKEDLLREARDATTTYERQDVETRTVRVWGDAAVVTALLWIKGVREGRRIDYRLWFSDTYVRTPRGWRYVLGQASLPLPPTPQAR